MKLTLFTVIVTAALSLAMTAKANYRLGAIVQYDFFHGLEDGQTQQNEITVKPNLEWWVTDDIRLTAVGRIRSDFEDEIEPDQGDQSEIDAISRRAVFSPHLEAELREFYFDIPIYSSALRAGKQQIVWGQSDGLKVLDVVNPQSFREFILDDFVDSRIPLWSLNWEVPLNSDWNAELVWIPDQTFDDIPEADAQFAITSPVLVPQPSDAVPAIFNGLERPNATFEDSDAGFRLLGFVNGWDLTINYLYHFLDTPVTETLFNGTAVEVSQFYERSHLIGGTASNAFGDFTLRTELGYSTDKFFVSGSPFINNGVTETDEFAYVVGLDYQGISDTFISGQVFQSIVNVPDDEIVRDRVQTNLTFLIRRDFANDTWQAEVLTIHGLNGEDGILRPKLSYDYQANIILSLGADIFYGSSEGIFGQFDGNDRLYAGVEVGF